MWIFLNKTLDCHSICKFHWSFSAHHPLDPRRDLHYDPYDHDPHHDYDYDYDDPLHSHQNVHLPLHQFSLFHQVQRRLQMHHLEDGIDYHQDGEEGVIWISVMFNSAPKIYHHISPSVVLLKLFPCCQMFFKIPFLTTFFSCLFPAAE